MLKTKTKMNSNNPFYFQVSVIIPVYNAEKYLQKAVESALQFKEVQEVILVEDKSPDNAMVLCEKLALQDNRVQVYTHPNNENRGAGASRNLGIEKSTCEFVAFLDADDWYLPNRFDIEKVLFKYQNIDGIYGATGFYYQKSNLIDIGKLTTVKKDVSTNDLLYEFLKPNGGRFTTDAITIRKELLSKTGLFDVNLKLHQDSELFAKFIYFGNLVEGIVEKPIAYRRVHTDNRITKRNRNTALKYHFKMLNNFIAYKNVNKKIYRILFSSFIINKTQSNNNINRFILAFKELIANPKLIPLLLKGS